jgi:hypothetical protein
VLFAYYLYFLKILGQITLQTFLKIRQLKCAGQGFFKPGALGHPSLASRLGQFCFLLFFSINLIFQCWDFYWLFFIKFSTNFYDVF